MAATRSISGVTSPRRACSSWVTGSKPSGATANSPSRRQPSGMKSQAVLPHGAGMPGVSGDEKVSAAPMAGAFANEPGVVPASVEEGLAAPFSGRGSFSWVIRSLSSSSVRRAHTGGENAAFPPPVRAGSGSTGSSQPLGAPRATVGP